MATGYYHIYNALKFKILYAMYKINKTTTTSEIADFMGLDRQRVRDELSRWHKRKYRYVRRLDKKELGSKAFRYSLNQYGVATLEMYTRRRQKWQDFNCRDKSKKPREVDSYLKINKHGEALGLTVEDVIKTAKSKATGNK